MKAIANEELKIGDVVYCMDSVIYKANAADVPWCDPSVMIIEKPLAKNAQYVMGESGSELFTTDQVLLRGYNKICQYCGNKSGKKDSRGGCISCGGQ